MTSLSAIKLDIDNKSYSYAKIYASLIKDDFQRKRAYASLVALYAFLNLVERTPFNIQKAMTLFRNPALNEKYEISDLYINNWHLDVRIVVSGNAFLIPKTHIDNNLMPDFYIVVKVDKNLEHAELVGIADTKSMKTEPFDYHYNLVSFSELISYDDFLLKIQKEKKIEFSQEEHEMFRSSYLSVADGEANQETINNVLRHVFECSDCRTEFCCFTGFEMVSCNTGKYPEVLEDQTLNIVGAQNVNEEKYKGQEEKIYIGNDEEKAPEEKTENESAETDILSEDTPNEQQEQNKEQKEEPQEEKAEENLLEDTTDDKDETVSDILDELFNVEEDYIAHQEAEAKELNESEIKPLKEVSGDLSVIEETPEDETVEPLQEEPNEIETIEESNENELVELDKDTELVEYSDDGNIEHVEPLLDEENKENDIIPLEENNEPDILEETSEQKENNQNVQKVIIDYDETGEPVYSYITNVNNSNDIDLIEDDNSEIDLNNDEPEDIIWEDKAEAEADVNEEKPEEKEEIQPVEDTKEVEEEPLQNIEETSHEPSVENTDNNEAVEELENDAEEYEDSDENEEELEEYSDDEDSEEYEDNEDDEEYEEDDEEYDDEDEEYEDEEEETPKRGSSKIVAIFVALLVAVGLIGGGAMFFMKNSQNAKEDIAQTTNDDINIEIPAQQENTNNNENGNTDDLNIETPPPAPVVQQQTEAPTEAIDIPQLTENDLIVENKQTPVSDPNKAITNAFSKGGVAHLTVSGINWNCSSALFTDKTFKAYLQHLDNMLKQNLKTNILNATETPQHRAVGVKLAVKNDGNLEKAMVAESSGSNQVDNIVLQSINEMFESEKSPILNNSNLKQDIYYIKVVIKF